MGYYVKAIAGFIVLDLYLNFGIARSGSFWLQALLVVLFFPLLKGILALTKVGEFRAIGISFHSRWFNNMLLGFAIGFSCWLVLYTLQYAFDGFDVIGIQSFPELVMPLFMILLTFLVGSMLNDIVVRGYVFGHLRGRIPMKGVFLLSLAIYTLDDVWNEGFSLGNTLFSIVLGLSVTYAIYRTGSIWATTGIHWGLNVCYGIFYGILGSSGEGIVLTEELSPTIMSESVLYAIPLLMFASVFFLRRRFAKVS